MREYRKFYVGGQWVDPVEVRILDVENPATESVCGRIAIGCSADVDRAVAAARSAFPDWSQSSRADPPPALAAGPQVQMGLGHLAAAIDVLKNFSFEEPRGATLVVKEAIGVCALITPWNWPLNQIACKVYPALAAGCTMILKTSEIAPFSGQIFTERNDMTIAREEIFGPVLCILGYGDPDEAVTIGNDTGYGLYGYVCGADLERARALARRIRAGTVAINHALDIRAPFGGYQHSGNGRECGEFGFSGFLELKAIVGYGAHGSDDDGD